MQQSCLGIVLHYVKFSESSIIAHIYTREFGRQSFMVSGIKGKRSKNKLSFFQPLSLVSIEAYMKQTRDLHKVKEIRIDEAYQSIPFDVYKGTQALFLAEFLYKTLREEEANPPLFEFLKQSLLILDISTEATANFHLYFIAHLSKYFGFFPNNNFCERNLFFNMKKAQFVSFEGGDYILGRQESVCISKLLAGNYSEMGQVKISGKLRMDLLKYLIEYYQIHFDKKIHINSLAVLEELFHS